MAKNLYYPRTRFPTFKSVEPSISKNLFSVQTDFKSFTALAKLCQITFIHKLGQACSRSSKGIRSHKEGFLVQHRQKRQLKIRTGPKMLGSLKDWQSGVDLPQTLAWPAPACNVLISKEEVNKILPQVQGISTSCLCCRCWQLYATYNLHKSL